jgi:hypothetical protein
MNKDRPALKCFEAAIGFDRSAYEAKKESVDQSTPLARFYQDQILEVWDPVLEAKAKANDSTAVNYKDLLKFWDKGIGDANTSTLNFAALRSVLDHIENPDKFVTVEQLIGNHDQDISLSLQQGPLACRAEDMVKKFNMSDKTEQQLTCERPPDANAALKSLGFEGQMAVADNLKPVSSEIYYGVPAILLGLAAVTGISGLLLGLRKGRKQSGGQAKPDQGTQKTPPASPSTGTRAVSDSTALAAPRPATARVVAATPPPLPNPASPPATRTVAAADGDMDDLAAALRNAGKDKSPVPGGASPSGPPTGTGITADNVIIRGADGRPSAEINRSVVMAEIAYLNPKFLTDDGTAIHSNYRAGVEHLADLAMTAFGDRGADAPNPGELWRIEHGARGSMIRGGLPEAWLRTFVNGQLERWHAAGAPGMSFDAVAREAMERDAARRAGERSAYERWVEDALRDPARLAGR